MGKGDKRSRKGKVWRGSYGKSRPQKDTTKPKYVAKPKPKKVVDAPVEETLFEMPAVEGAEKAAKPKKAAAPKKPKVEGEKKAPAKPKKKADEAPAESATEATEVKTEE